MSTGIREKYEAAGMRALVDGVEIKEMIHDFLAAVITDDADRAFALAALEEMTHKYQLAGKLIAILTLELWYPNTAAAWDKCAKELVQNDGTIDVYDLLSGALTPDGPIDGEVH